MIHHKNGIPECPMCEDKLKYADPLLAKWFRECVKPAFPLAHISWSYRGKTEQDDAFKEGKSKLKFPQSQHNATDSDGKPCARALDLFELELGGMACWAWGFFRDIAMATRNFEVPILWGGNWPALQDADHFELPNKKA